MKSLLYPMVVFDEILNRWAQNVNELQAFSEI